MSEFRTLHVTERAWSEAPASDPQDFVRLQEIEAAFGNLQYASHSDVEDLQIDRNVPVHVLNELVKQTPEGTYFTSVKQDGQTLVVSGVAQTNERVSEFLRNTANNSEWLVKPELVEIKAATAQPGAANRSEQKRLFDFAVRLVVKRPQDKDKASDATASPAKPASAPAATVAKKA